MESKIRTERSRKISLALLRRAIALNPKKNSRVLNWAMFAAAKDLDWVESAGGAAVDAVRSALSPPLPVSRPASRSSSSSPATAPAATCASAGGGGGGRQGRRRITRAEQKEERGFAMELLALCRSKEALQTEEERQRQQQQQPEKAASVTAGHHSSPCSSSPPLPSTSDLHSAAPAPAAVAAATTPAYSAAPSARFVELAGELERRAGGAERGGRELYGSWKLVFTTCAECNRVLARTGASLVCWHPPCPLTDSSRKCFRGPWIKWLLKRFKRRFPPSPPCPS